jgi:hypothetical protein
MTLSIDTYFCKHLWILVGLLRLLGKCLAPSAVVSDSKGLCSSLKTKTMAIVLTCHRELQDSICDTALYVSPPAAQQPAHLALLLLCSHRDNMEQKRHW